MALFALTDQQLETVTTVARQLVPPHLRNRYLEAVAVHFRGQDFRDADVQHAARAAANELRRTIGLTECSIVDR
jgi:hypothetical protein